MRIGLRVSERRIPLNELMKQETTLQASYTLLHPIEARDVTGYNHVRMRRNMMIFNAEHPHGRQNVACPDEGEPLGT